MTRRHLRMVMPGVLALAVTGCDREAPEPAARPVPPSVEPSPYRRDALTDAQLARTRILQQTFADVDTSSLETWVAGFRRAVNLDDELARWEAIAKAYREYTAVRNLVPGGKADVLQILLLRSNASSDDWVLANVRLRALSVGEAREVLKHYTGAPPSTKALREPGR